MQPLHSLTTSRLLEVAGAHAIAGLVAADVFFGNGVVVRLQGLEDDEDALVVGSVSLGLGLYFFPEYRAPLEASALRVVTSWK